MLRLWRLSTIVHIKTLNISTLICSNNSSHMQFTSLKKILTSCSPSPFTLCLLHSPYSYTIMTCIHLIAHSLSQQVHTHLIIIQIYQPWDQQASLKNSCCCFIMFVCIPLSQIAMLLVLLKAPGNYNLLKLPLPNYSLTNSLQNIFHLSFHIY